MPECLGPGILGMSGDWPRSCGSCMAAGSGPVWRLVKPSNAGSCMAAGSCMGHRPRDVSGLLVREKALDLSLKFVEIADKSNTFF